MKNKESPVRNFRVASRKKKVAKEVKAIIFDLGNVLIGFDHRIAVKRILTHTLVPEQEIYDLFFDSRLTNDFERGSISPLSFFEKVKSMLGLSLSFDEFSPIWNEIFFSKHDTEEFIGSLDPGLPLLLLSNINKLHYEHIRRIFSSAMDLFDTNSIIPSYTTGFVKPEKEIYDIAIATSGVKKDELVYVDDRRDLIEAAQSYGIRSIQFEGVAQLAKEFKKLGIL